MKNTFILCSLLLCLTNIEASELFVRVNTNGSFYATAGNQSHYNYSTTFRFFDLPQGSTKLVVGYPNSNELFYSGTLNLEYQQRVIAEIDQFGNLTVIQRETINYSNWYTCSSSNQAYGNNYGNYGNTNYGNTNYGYNEFLKLLDKEPFDSNKLTTAQKYVDKTMLSAAEIAGIATKFIYDSNRLEWAKYAYTKCYDKANYFLLKSTFTYNSNYTDLENYMEKH